MQVNVSDPAVNYDLQVWLFKIKIEITLIVTKCIINNGAFMDFLVGIFS